MRCNIRSWAFGSIANQDTFTFQWEPVQVPRWTKREMCSVAGRLFDPMGLLSPVTILGKLIVQQLWCLELDWDVELPVMLVNEWEAYLASLSELTALKIPGRLLRLPLRAILGWLDLPMQV